MMQVSRLTSGLALAACLLFSLTACIPPQSHERPLARFADHLPAEPDPAEEPAPASLPPQVASALLPPLPSASAAETESRFDVEARQIPARDFFLGLVAETSVNMVVHPDVSGEITLTMKNVTISEVVAAIQAMYGYEFRRTGSGYMVLPAGLQTRIFHIDYLNLVRRGLSQTQVSSGQVSESRSSDDNRYLDGREQRNGDRRDRDLAVSGSRIDTESITDFWQELQVALQAIIGSAEGRQVVIQPQAGLVVVRAFPAELQQIERYIDRIQGNLHRQVILEAKILEVELRDGFQTGINWSLLFEHGRKTAVIGQTGGGSFFEQGISEIAGNTGRLNPLAPQLPEGTDTSAFGGVFSAALNLGDFTAFIELLQTQGDVQVLSSPRVATMNNQKAVIKVGSDEFFVTDISNDTVVGTTTTLSTDVTLTPFFSGIALDVMPQIGAGGLVTLHIHPTISEVTDQSKVITIGEDTQILPLAFSRVRESDSIVSAESGQVVVIGGLMENRTRNETASVPLLGSIPGLGHLFRHQRSTSTKSELVILLRPIVKNRSIANRQLID